MTHLPVRRLPLHLKPDIRRTITRFFWPGTERAQKIISRVEDLDRKQMSELVSDVLKQFTPGNPGLDGILLAHYEKAIHQAQMPFNNDIEVRLMTGAYFSMEYAFESAALFNPSVVAAIDQPSVDEGILHFVMSLRAVGEGHLSSITFRRGLMDRQGNIQIIPAGLEVRQLHRKENRTFTKAAFIDKLEDLENWNELTNSILNELSETFSTCQLQHTIERIKCAATLSETDLRTLDLILWLAQSEYEIERQDTEDLENLVLFPLSETESQGMEDMRLVRFTHPDGVVRYYGTYTAFNGVSILPQILEVAPQEYAVVHTLHGQFARNKGMALFPEKINGRFAAIGRADGENMFLLYSDDIDFWDEAKEIIQPKYNWEFVQIGNCGSPLLTESGWLLLTHGVGPMRKYCIGAVLLDKDDPSRILGQLEQPLLSPTEEERSGYVPNVVYSCGGLIHAGNLLIPYGISDACTGFAVVRVDQLLAAMV